MFDNRKHLSVTYMQNTRKSGNQTFGTSLEARQNVSKSFMLHVNNNAEIDTKWSLWILAVCKIENWKHCFSAFCAISPNHPKKENNRSKDMEKNLITYLLHACVFLTNGLSTYITARPHILFKWKFKLKINTAHERCWES